MSATKRNLSSYYSGVIADRLRAIEKMPNITTLPAWAVGDYVRHKVTGIPGKLTDMMTQGGELWKLLPRGAKSHIVVHAKDLEREPLP